MANYRDNQTPATAENAAGSSETTAQASDPANTAPAFPDQDLNTAGDQSDTAARSVAENAKGADVGEPVSSGDGNMDLLLYSLGGDDAGMFSVDKKSGQISTAVALNFEARRRAHGDAHGDRPVGRDRQHHGGDHRHRRERQAGNFRRRRGVGRRGYIRRGDLHRNGRGRRRRRVGRGRARQAASFEISDDGALTFKDAPNFEDAKDIDEDGDSLGEQGTGDNVYRVIVTATGGTPAATGSHAVAVSVTNVNEDGSVSFDQPQPQGTRNLKASFSDQDGKDSPTWQWSRGPSAEGPWTEIDGATMSSRNPSGDDVGSYLQATVTYTDSFGEQTASGVTDNAVEPRTLANARPAFKADIDAITVDEGVKGAIGDPITATDADNDVLLYSIVADVDTSGNGVIDGDEDVSDDEKFTIGRTTGQLSLKAAANFEAASPAVDDS